MKVPRIVITGAPASAKTEFIERLKKNLELSHFVFLDELARVLLKENSDLRSHPIDLHCEIYHRQVAREYKLNGRPFISDRGTLDGFAFHQGSMEAIGTTSEKEYQRYTAVIQLGSAARLGDDFYQTDDIRQETLEQTIAIEDAIARIWNGHGAYCYIEAEPNIERKFDKFVKLVRQLAL